MTSQLAPKSPLSPPFLPLEKNQWHLPRISRASGDLQKTALLGVSTAGGHWVALAFLGSHCVLLGSRCLVDVWVGIGGGSGWCSSSRFRWVVKFGRFQLLGCSPPGCVRIVVSWGLTPCALFFRSSSTWCLFFLSFGGLRFIFFLFQSSSSVISIIFFRMARICELCA